MPGNGRLNHSKWRKDLIVQQCVCFWSLSFLFWKKKCWLLAASQIIAFLDSCRHCEAIFPMTQWNRIENFIQKFVRRNVTCFINHKVCRCKWNEWFASKKTILVENLKKNPMLLMKSVLFNFSIGLCNRNKSQKLWFGCLEVVFTRIFEWDYWYGSQCLGNARGRIGSPLLDW